MAISFSSETVRFELRIGERAADLNDDRAGDLTGDRAGDLGELLAKYEVSGAKKLEVYLPGLPLLGLPLEGLPERLKGEACLGLGERRDGDNGT